MGRVNERNERVQSFEYFQLGLARVSKATMPVDRLGTQRASFTLLDVPVQIVDAVRFQIDLVIFVHGGLLFFKQDLETLGSELAD